VTLRLASPVRYQIQAVDPVGRSLWGLDVSAERGLWLDHRNKATCSFEGSFDVSGIALGPFPLLSLPSLLMGRVPAEPAAEAEPALTDGQVEFRDEIGRRWAAEVGGDGAVEGWRLWDQEQPTVWFMRRDNWAYLSDRTRGVQVGLSLGPHARRPGALAGGPAGESGAGPGPAGGSRGLPGGAVPRPLSEGPWLTERPFFSSIYALRRGGAPRKALQCVFLSILPEPA
jgi:hypothetical protein